MHSVVKHFICSASTEETCNPKWGLKPHLRVTFFLFDKTRLQGLRAQLKALLLQQKPQNVCMFLPFLCRFVQELCPLSNLSRKVIGALV